MGTPRPLLRLANLIRGRKSFVITCNAKGRQRFYTAGRLGGMTPLEARTEALELIAPGMARIRAATAGQTEQRCATPLSASISSYSLPPTTSISRPVISFSRAISNT